MKKEIHMIKDLLEAFPFPILIVHNTGEILWGNPAVYDFFMIPARLEGINVKALFGEEFQRVLQRVVEEGFAIFNYSQSIALDKMVKETVIDIFPFETGGKNLIAVMLKDVTQQRLANAKEEKDKISIATEEIVKRIFLQLQPMVTGILSMCNYLEEVKGFDDEIATIKREANRLANVVDSALDLVLSNGEVESSVNLYRVLDQILESLRTELDEKGITVIKEYLPGIPELLGHPLEFFKAFLHLLRNAVEASPYGGEIYVSIRVDTDKKIIPKSRGCLIIEIADEGECIPEEIQSKMFLPFVTTKENHYGLGLSKAYKVIREKGGDIEYLRRDKKNIFSVYLPL
ncbi:two-component system sensor histidine kinase NtrB [Thermosulfidibacter takaii]|nr:ATP-binding protein [Thermosulfidibacter takaii]